MCFTRRFHLIKRPSTRKRGKLLKRSWTSKNCSLKKRWKTSSSNLHTSPRVLVLSTLVNPKVWASKPDLFKEVNSIYPGILRGQILRCHIWVNDPELRKTWFRNKLLWSSTWSLPTGSKKRTKVLMIQVWLVQVVMFLKIQEKIFWATARIRNRSRVIKPGQIT